MIHIEVASRDEVDKIVKHDDLYGRISDDYAPEAEELNIPELEHAFSGYVNDDLASLYIVNEGKMHFMVLKKYRGYAKKLLEKSFSYYNKDVYCIIPLCYDDVIKFAINCDFIIMDIVNNYRRIDGLDHKGVFLSRKAK